MAAKNLQFQPLHLPIPFLLLHFFSFFLLPPSASQSTPQNIQVYFPIPIPPLPPPLPPAKTTPSRSSTKTIAKAVAITAASSLVLSGLLFLLVLKFKSRSTKETTNLYADNGINYSRGLQKNDEFVRVGGIKGVIVDEQGLDVFYWKALEDNASFKQEISRVNENGGRKSKSDFPVQEIPFLRGKSSSSRVWPVEDYIKSQSETLSDVNTLKPVRNQEMKKSQPSIESLPESNTAIAATAPPPSPPPSMAVERKSNVAPPPPPPKTSGFTLSSRQPPPPPAKDNKCSSDENQVKLKPLHWDKVNADVGHSMVWHKLHNGSFRVDDKQMETLFGTMNINKKTLQPGTRNSPGPKAQMKSGPSRNFLLDTRKSQNIAIVIKSLAISRDKIISCLLKGNGLDTDTLEKLTRISPSKEEIQIILGFKEDITKLTEAESFLYHILKTIPSGFTRVNIMSFKSNYRSEVSDVKKSLHTLEMACEELNTRGLFVKLLEAVLKAGNRMNVGTSRGNAQAFNLNSLLKLSDVKSSDGKTTLLHFVVEEVIRSEGKRCNIKRSTGDLSSCRFTENYYIKLGLPVVGGVSSEFSNVKKAAGIDYNALSESCSELSVRLAEITKTMEECDGNEGSGGFVREMAMFLKGAKREIQVLREEESRIMGLVKATNEYYQERASKEGDRKELELFKIIRSFLDMVDKACIDIAIKLQTTRTHGRSPEIGLQMSKSPVKVRALPEHFTSGSSSDDEYT